MTRVGRALLAGRALLEFLRYDTLGKLGEFPGIPALPAEGHVPREGAAVVERDICRAVTDAAAFYWCAVPCLQRSVAMVRLLRRRGVSARLVVGYRPIPFTSHAWVEVDGRVLNDSPVYAQRFRVLYSA